MSEIGLLTVRARAGGFSDCENGHFTVRNLLFSSLRQCGRLLGLLELAFQLSEICFFTVCASAGGFLDCKNLLFYCFRQVTRLLKLRKRAFLLILGLLLSAPVWAASRIAQMGFLLFPPLRAASRTGKWAFLLSKIGFSTVRSSTGGFSDCEN